MVLLRYNNKLEIIMQLKDFISNALIEICSVIAEAKAQIGNHAIAPCSAKIGDAPKENTHSIEQIGFEICVTVDNTNGTVWLSINGQNISAKNKLVNQVQ